MPGILEGRVSRLEAQYDSVKEDMREHDADIRQLREWRAAMAQSARDSIRQAGQRFVLAGLVLTLANIGLSIFLSHG